MPLPVFSSSKIGTTVETKYMPLAEEAPLMEGSDTDLPLANKKKSLPAKLRAQAPWIVSGILLILLIASLTFRRNDYYVHSTSPSPSFETGFDLELSTSIPAKAHIRMHNVKYRGTPQFGADGEEYVDYLPGEVRYVGPPSDEIDEAWNQLTTRRFFLLSAEEAEAQWGAAYKNYWNANWGGYVASLDLFHSLHCLDHIRKSLYPDHYHQGKLHGDIHNGHCIDHIRQQIMCQADLTPLPSQRFENVNKNYLDSDRTHTCRDFSQIRQFVHLRYNQSLTGNEVPTGHYAPGHEGTSSWGPV